LLPFFEAKSTRPWATCATNNASAELPCPPPAPLSSSNAGLVWFVCEFFFNNLVCLSVKFDHSLKEAPLMPSSVPLEGQLCTASFIGEVRDVRTLLGSRADVSESDKGGDTPLHLTAVGGYVEVGRMLIEANADVGVRDKFGLSPLHTAA